MIRPDSRGIMCCSARRMPQNTWLRFQSTSSAHSSSVICATGAVIWHAARVQAADVELAEAVDGEVDQALHRRLLRGVAGEERDVARRRPSPRRTVWPFVSSRPLTTTLAPSASMASAMARPMLRVPPVMQATFPSSFFMIPLSASVRPCAARRCGSVRRRAAVDRDQRAGDARRRRRTRAARRPAPTSSTSLRRLIADSWANTSSRPW